MKKCISVVLAFIIIISAFCACNKKGGENQMDSKLNKSKVYGVEFDCKSEESTCKRIADAENMTNDYLIGENFKNGGRNDFDNAYPFGAIKLCCVKVKDGKREIIYEGEKGFARDGSAGNVMVEIPKFYSKREKDGSIERVYICGEKKEGFSLEPVFKNGKKELNCVYVGVYNSTKRENGIFSSSYGVPDFNKTILDFQSDFMKSGYNSYDFATLLCLQRLMLIEMGTRNPKNELGGLQHFAYCSRANENNCIVALSKNSVTIKALNRNGNFFVGAAIGFGKGGSEDKTIRKTVTDIKKDGDNLIISYDGEDVSDKLTVNQDAAYGIVQPNGLSDTLNYHTGRCDNQTPYADNYGYLLQGFKYRNIENVWGNVWEFVSGLKIKQLEYYYTFDTSLYSLDIKNWKKLSYPAPEQPQLPNIDDSKSWINEFGFDNTDSLVTLPSLLGTGSQNLKFGGVCYAYKDTDYDGNKTDPKKVYTYAAGAGFDHTWGSLFTVRGFLSDSTKNWLYGNRIVLR